MANENEINFTRNPYFDPLQSFEPSWQPGDGVRVSVAVKEEKGSATKPARTEYVTITPAQREQLASDEFSCSNG